jgi:hypothetical protein
VGKTEGKRPLGKPRRSLVDNIKINLIETVWTGLIWLRIETSGNEQVLSKNIPLASEICHEIFVTVQGFL